MLLSMGALAQRDDLDLTGTVVDIELTETDKPFAVRRGDTVLDVAKLVHRDIARDLKFARIWGENVFDVPLCLCNCLLSV